MFPSEEHFQAVIDASRQAFVNSEKTSEGRQQLIDELSGWEGPVEVNGREYEPRPLVVDDPNAPTKPKPIEKNDEGLESFDFKRGRLRTDNRWVNVDSQVGEIFREIFRGLKNLGAGASYLDLEETIRLLNCWIEAYIRVKRLLEDPFNGHGSGDS
ncbi:hypothetical protein GCM10028792_18650 [Salinisphaera aquimarina]